MSRKIYILCPVAWTPAEEVSARPRKRVRLLAYDYGPMNVLFIAVALEFSRQNSETLRYVNLWHRWFRWNGVLWRRVEDLSVFHQIRLLARRYAKLFVELITRSQRELSLGTL